MLDRASGGRQAGNASAVADISAHQLNPSLKFTKH
jgi:hypothetical protein